MLLFQQTDGLLLACRLVSCVLSFVGALFIILSYYLFKESRTFGRKLLLILSTQDLLLSVAYALPGEAAPGLCKFQSIAVTFFGCSSVLWTSCIAWYVYQSVNGLPSDRHEWRMHVVAWGYSLFTAIFVACLNSDLTGEGWCWVPDSSVNTRWARLALYYIPLWLIWAFNAIAYAVVHMKIKRMLGLGVSQKEQRHIRSVYKLLFVPVVLVLLRIAGSINRTYGLVRDNQDIYALTVLQALGDPGQGFADALIFGAFNRRLLKRFLAVLATCRMPERDELSDLKSSSIRAYEERVAVDSARPRHSAYGSSDSSKSADDSRYSHYSQLRGDGSGGSGGEFTVDSVESYQQRFPTLDKQAAVGSAESQSFDQTRSPVIAPNEAESSDDEEPQYSAI